MFVDCIRKLPGRVSCILTNKLLSVYERIMANLSIRHPRMSTKSLGCFLLVFVIFRGVSGLIIPESTVQFLRSSLRQASQPPNTNRANVARSGSVLLGLEKKIYERCELLRLTKAKGPLFFEGVEEIPLEVVEYSHTWCTLRTDLGDDNVVTYDCANSPQGSELMVQLAAFYATMKDHNDTKSLDDQLEHASIVTLPAGLFSCKGSVFLLRRQRRNAVEFMDIGELESTCSLDSTNYHEEAFENAILQVVLGLASLQQNLGGLTSYECIPDNFLVVPWASKEHRLGKTIKYNIGRNNTVSIPDLGFRVVLERLSTTRLRHGNRILTRIPGFVSVARKLFSLVIKKIMAGLRLSINTVTDLMPEFLSFLWRWNWGASWVPSLTFSFVDENLIRLQDERREGKSGRSFDLAHFMRTLLTELRHNLYRHRLLQEFQHAEEQLLAIQLGPMGHKPRLNPWYTPTLRMSLQGLCVWIVVIVGFIFDIVPAVWRKYQRASARALYWLGAERGVLVRLFVTTLFFVALLLPFLVYVIPLLGFTITIIWELLRITISKPSDLCRRKTLRKCIKIFLRSTVVCVFVVELIAGGSPWWLPHRSRPYSIGYFTNEQASLAVPLGTELLTPISFVQSLSARHFVHLDQRRVDKVGHLQWPDRGGTRAFHGKLVPLSLGYLTHRTKASLNMSFSQLGTAEYETLYEDVLVSSPRAMKFFLGGSASCIPSLSKIPVSGDLGSGACGSVHSLEVLNPMANRKFAVAAGDGFRVRALILKVDHIHSEEVIVENTATGLFTLVQRGHWTKFEKKICKSNQQGRYCSEETIVDQIQLRFLRMTSDSSALLELRDIDEDDGSKQKSAISSRFLALKSVRNVKPSIKEWNMDFVETTPDVNEIIVQMLTSKLTANGISPNFMETHAASFCDHRDRDEQYQDAEARKKETEKTPQEKLDSLAKSSRDDEALLHLKWHLAAVSSNDKPDIDTLHSELSHLSTSGQADSDDEADSGDEALDLALLMEIIEGGRTLRTFSQKTIAPLMYLYSKEKRTNVVPTAVDFMENALFQVIAALHTFQTHFRGMHNDLHTSNVFIKLVDDTLYGPQGKKKPLRDYDYFEYSIEGQTFRIPNLGFVVKLGDMGLANIAVPANMDADGISTFPRILTHDEPLREIVAADIETSTGQLLNLLGIMPHVYSVLDTLLLRSYRVLGYHLDFVRYASRVLDSWVQRGSRHFDPGWDLATLMNNLMADPVFFSPPVVSRYRTLNEAKVRATGLIPDNVDLRYRYTFGFGSVKDFPTKYIPRSDMALVTPRDLLFDESLFASFRMQADKSSE